MSISLFGTDRISVFRVFSVAVITAYTAYGIALKYRFPDQYNPLEHRFLFLGIVYLLAFLSLYVKVIKRNFIRIMYVMAFMVTGHYFFLAYVNSLPALNVLGAILITTIIGFVFEVKLVHFVYVVFSVLLTVPFYFVEAQFEPRYLTVSILLMAAMTHLTNVGKHKILEAHEKTSKDLEAQHKLMQDIFKLTSTETGQDLFDSLVVNMTKSFNNFVSFVGRYNSQTNEMNSFALSVKGELIEGRKLYDISETPCYGMLAADYVIIQSDLHKKFPMLKELFGVELESYAGVKICNDAGEFIGVFVVMDVEPIKDVELIHNVLNTLSTRVGSEFKRVEQQYLIDSQKMRMTESARLAALGEMAGGIAHEINNPLAIIKVSAEMLSHRIQLGQFEADLFQSNLAKIDATVERITKIVMGLKRLTRGSSAKEQDTISVFDIVQDAVSIVEQKMKDHQIDLQVEGGREDYYVIGNGVQIGQVVVNIVTNAIHELTGQEDAKIRIFSENSNDRLSVVIANNGPKIPPEIERRIMEPFFTTKEIGVGTGLGLSISQNLMNYNGGDLLLKQTDDEVQFVLSFSKIPKKMSA